MKAMILAAGRGLRMMPLSARTPKPLLKVWGMPMIVRQILCLKKVGIISFVINAAYRSQLLVKALGDGSQLGVNINWSIEGQEAQDALGTLGGIVKAIPLLGMDEPFVCTSADVVTDYPYQNIFEMARRVVNNLLAAHFVLVPNPPFHPLGDMDLSKEGYVEPFPPKYTYGNIAVFSPRIFDMLPYKAQLFPWVYQFARQGIITGEIYKGKWANVGTPADIAILDAVKPFAMN